MTASELPRMRLRSGVCALLEEAADELLRLSLVGITSHAEKSDILTPWKDRDRHDREVLSASGQVDPSIRRGMARRAANTVQTHLNSRDCPSPATRWTRANDPTRFIEGSGSGGGEFD